KRLSVAWLRSLPTTTALVKPAQRRLDGVAVCQRRALQYLRDHGRRFAARHMDDLVIEPIKKAGLRVADDARANRRSTGGLFDDHQGIGLAHALADGVPVDAGAVQRAQVDDF